MWQQNQFCGSKRIYNSTSRSFKRKPSSWILNGVVMINLSNGYPSDNSSHWNKSRYLINHIFRLPTNVTDTVLSSWKVFCQSWIRFCQVGKWFVQVGLRFCQVDMCFVKLDTVLPSWHVFCQVGYGFTKLTCVLPSWTKSIRVSDKYSNQKIYVKFKL